MTDDRNIYLLNPKELSPETIAVAFAKTSRSPKSFRDIAQELSDETAADFHEKWVIGYGHASVAEHAVLHIAVENISRLAIETLESNRLASYTEKSTRYQKWDPDFFYIPKELINTAHETLFRTTCKMLFNTYQAALPKVKAVIEKEFPIRPNEAHNAWDRRVRTEYVDICRFILPAASIANVGVTMNARTLEHAISKLLSHPLHECQSIGAEIKRVTQKEVPTLVKYAEVLPYLQNSQKSIKIKADQIRSDSQIAKDWCKLISYEVDGENQILAAALYRYGGEDFETYLQKVQKMSTEDKAVLASYLLGDMGPHDFPLRELEHSWFKFDIILDQGAYFELKRHRMMTQSAQMLTTRLGYTIPKKIELANFTDPYKQAMDQVINTFELIYQDNPFVASYIVPNSFKRRVLLTFNLRSAFHLISLRSAANAHFSIRRIAQRLADEISKVFPLMSEYINRPNETWQHIEQEFFTNP